MEDDSKSKACGKSSPTFDISDEIKKLSLNDEEASSTFQQNYGYSDSAGSSKIVMTKQNATNFHPLMHSSVSQDFPDLIPENQRSKMFRPECHSSPTEVQLDNELQKSLEEKINMALSNYSYDERIQGFPESPSVLKETLKFEMPVEINTGDLSDTENDKSAYEAHLNCNLQNVSLILNQKEGNLNFLAHKKQSNKLRKVKVIETNHSLDCDDISSLDSNSDSLKSEDVFAGTLETKLEDEEDVEDTQETNTPEPIEPLSADDERKHARYWQRMVLPDGEQRTIDMRVIEPYKRVLSHGGYLRAGGHTAIVVFSACYLPNKSRTDYDYVMDNLFLYVLWTLERLVTDDYILVYLHGGATKLPSFSWLKRCYHMVGRRLRKNLTHLYLVHPTLWIKTVLFMAKPFISSKFYRKLSFIASLRELLARVPLEAAAIPDKVKAYDSLHCQ